MTRFVRFMMSDGYEEVLLPVDRVVSVQGYTAKAEKKHLRATICYSLGASVFGGTGQVVVNHSVQEVESRLNAAEQAS